MSENTIKDILIELGLSTEKSIEPYFPVVRDSAEYKKPISVLRCARSGVFLLSRTDHIGSSHYKEKKLDGLGSKKRKEVLERTRKDTKWRVDEFGKYIKGKIWLDFGAGAGGVVKELASSAKKTIAVELQNAYRNSIKEADIKKPALEAVEEDDIEVVTLFHVLEHLQDPIEKLKLIHSKLAPGGMVLIEVPHARDALITLYECEAFKRWTFWSEHLILHTRESLKTFLEAAGFKVSDEDIRGRQRYPLANHLCWLAKGVPGGHEAWPQLVDKELDSKYHAVLDSLVMTDTLVAIGKK